MKSWCVQAGPEPVRQTKRDARDHGLIKELLWKYKTELRAVERTTQANDDSQPNSVDVKDLGLVKLLQNGLKGSVLVTETGDVEDENDRTLKPREQLKDVGD